MLEIDSVVKITVFGGYKSLPIKSRRNARNRYGG